MRLGDRDPGEDWTLYASRAGWQAKLNEDRDQESAASTDDVVADTRRSAVTRWARLGVTASVGAALAIDWWTFMSAALSNPEDTLNLGRFFFRASLSAVYLFVVWRIYSRTAR